MKGGVAAMVLAAEMLAAPRRPAGRRPARQHDHRRGVDAAPAASLASPTACAPTPASCPSRPLRRLDRLPRLGLPDDHGRGPPRPRRAAASRTGATAAPSTRSRRRRSCSTRSRRLREEWRTRADLQHPYLSPPDIVPTLMHAGEWSVTYPASCAITSAVLFPPALADADGYGSRVRSEVRSGSSAPAPPIPGWPSTRRCFAWAADIPPMEIPPDDPIVQTVLRGERRRRRALAPRAGSTPGTTARPTRSRRHALDRASARARSPGAHTIDEYVPVDDLVRCAQAIALAAVRFCGTA